MPRSSKNTLYTINPEKLADEVVHQVHAHAQHLAIGIGMALSDPMVEVAGKWVPTPGPNNLWHSVHTLARYAIHGGQLDAPVHEYLISMMPIWSRAADSGGVTTPEFDDPDKANPEFWVGQLVYVMRGALGREQLDRGKAIAPAELAVLGGVSPQHVRLLLRNGEIVGEDDGSSWTVPAVEAKRWLATRNVGGWGDEASTVRKVGLE